MKRIAKKREIVKGNERIEVQEEWLKDLVEAEEGQVLGQIRGELFGLFKLLIERTMQLELEAMLGYAPYRKDGNGNNSRNGYRERKKLVLKEGLLENLKVPRDRNGEYRTEILPRLKRYEPAILDYVQQLYLNCNSTRPLSGMLTTLFGWPMSHGQVSNFCQVLDKEVEEWKKRPLADIYVGLFLDAVWLPLRRYRQKSEKECMLLALGVTKDGIKEVLGMRLVAEESAEGWAELLAELKARGLKGKELLLAVTDGLPGLKEILRRLFSGLAIQRCVVHKERNVLRYVPHHSKEAVAEALKNIFSSNCVEDALRRKDDFCAKWKKIFPSAVRSLETDFEDSITFLKIKNYQLRKLFYSNNPIERINKEIKRRVKVMEILPAEESAYRVVYWIVQKLSKSWRLRRVRGYAHLGDLKNGFTH
jgi:transposase-like protein